MKTKPTKMMEVLVFYTNYTRYRFARDYVNKKNNCMFSDIFHSIA